jgi:methyl acetate hydrolase
MSQLQAILDAAVAEGRAPGFTAAVRTADGTRTLARAGVRGADNPAPMSDHTLFSIASCTKAVTSVAAMQLVERGLLDLDAPVGERLPLLAQPKVLEGFDAEGGPRLRPARRPITLRHLLSHTSGLGYDFTSEALAKWAAHAGVVLMGGAEDPDLPLVFEPGEGWLYGVGIDWAGRLIEAVSGQPLDDYVGANILEPLGMADTSFFPAETDAPRKASVHIRGEDGGFVPIPFGMPPVRHFMMGGAGLYSTADDYLKFLEAILAGGAPLLGPEAFATLMANQVGEMDAGPIKSANPLMARDFEPLPGLTRRHSLAGLINLDPVPAGRAAGSLAWAGIANCYYWADPASGVAGVVMAQVMPFADPAVLDTFEAVEKSAYA